LERKCYCCVIGFINVATEGVRNICEWNFFKCFSQKIYFYWNYDSVHC